jgi:hypothetical protein
LVPFHLRRELLGVQPFSHFIGETLSQNALNLTSYDPNAAIGCDHLFKPIVTEKASGS